MATDIKNSVENKQKPEFIYKMEGYRILGACFNVYKELGNGYLESVYQECLALEFEDMQVPYLSHPKLEISYRNKTISQFYVPDFVCFDKIVLKLKTVHAITDEHRSQLYNYLKVTGFKVGYLINFGHFPLLEHERLIK